MTSDDRDAVVAFVAALPAHDLLFVPRDIGHPQVIDGSDARARRQRRDKPDRA